MKERMSDKLRFHRHLKKMLSRRVKKNKILYRAEKISRSLQQHKLSKMRSLRFLNHNSQRRVQTKRHLLKAILERQNRLLISQSRLNRQLISQSRLNLRTKRPARRRAFQLRICQLQQRVTQ